jgi:hypothetical protein
LRFGEDGGRGRVAPGLAADLVVLGSDPIGGPRAFADVRWAIRGGRVVYDAAAPVEQAWQGPASPRAPAVVVAPDSPALAAAPASPGDYR